ncbi:type II CRISPR RNA-guided endonuclease Cas9 [Pelagibacterium sediminicola]|uniref:type II CRISPR RNA-guided endonuclease Cas9 n=1 Tax=Pelagibacterium sediminicola TaxID=2248761 RepID=UPI001FEB2149|nr:type II CRISPR RNA-guided endonuclease Cas9 [Pelagibacterium sediminicola]
MLDRTHFSFDMGTNSIGWAVFGLDADGNPNRIIDSGVRIFSDGREPKSGTSLAEGRRVARGMARRRDRYKRRRKAVLRVLAEYGLMPDTPEARRRLVAETNDRKSGVPQDVYALRARALDEKLPLFHVGRALFHLNQRRGFKSNRKTDSRDNESGKIATGIAELDKQLAGRTLGQYLFEKRGTDRQDHGRVRVRPEPRVNEKGKEVEVYGFYPQRAMLEKEFNAIWAAQALHYPDVLTEERREHLFRVMFYQRPLKPALVGKCSFNPAEPRIAKAHPLFQTFRLYKEVNELRIVTQTNSQGIPLTLEQRDLLVTLLRTVKESSYKALLGKIVKGQPDARFNKASDARDKMKGDEVAAEMSHKTRFGQQWFALDETGQWAVIEKLRETDDPLELNAWLEAEFGFEPERRDAVASARLPEGYGRLGETALRSMLDELKADVISEAEAAKRAGYDHALARLGKGLECLPNYQEVLERRIPPGTGEPDDPYDIRMGRITNPTVHIALNQLRRVVNALIRKYGKPGQIAIELARDLKLSEEQKREVNARIAKNTRDAQRRAEKLLETGVENNGYNRALLRFWEELGEQPVNRVCVYCGGAIGIETLFSGVVDIDHILPWSRTLDDSRANRILVHNTCNRLKRNFAPFDVPEWKATYPEILERAAKLHHSKRWRFAPDAWERFDGEESFLARQLTDTQYLARLAHEYLASLYSDEESDEWGVFSRRNHVRVVPGRLTEMLRRAWGLNSVLADHNQKNRNDHRHHAIDAIVVGVTTRAMLQRISHEAARGADVGSEDALRRFDPPWEDFREDVQAAVGRITVSHRPDHGTLPSKDKPGSTAGQLHNDTAYGLTGEDRNGVPIVVRRKPFLSLEPRDLPSIRDDQLRDYLEHETYGLTGKDFTEALQRIKDRDPKYKGIRRVRVTEVLNVIPITDSSGKPYKAYKGDANFRYDVWELPNGRWVHEVVSMYEAHRSDWTSKIHAENPAARRVLSLKQNDLVAYEHPETGLTYGRVVKFGQSGQMTFAAHNEAGPLKARDADRDDPFKYFYKSAGAMKDIGLRQIRVDEIGQVFDPGPQDRASRKARAQGPLR